MSQFENSKFDESKAYVAQEEEGNAFVSSFSSLPMDNTNREHSLTTVERSSCCISYMVIPQSMSFEARLLAFSRPSTSIVEPKSIS